MKSLKCGKERILKPWINSSGYMFIGLYKNHIVKYSSIHRLVAQAFIPNLYNKPQVNHLDENKKNNCVENLEWIRHIKSGNFIREWPSTLEVKRILGIGNSHIIACCKGKRKSTGNFIWRYKEKD